jgi:glycosyltransferase involved in cell wall biosynthesis
MGRILMVVRASKGGSFGHVTKLSAALVERGHDVVIAGPHEVRQAPDGVEIVPLDMGREVSPAGDLATTARLARVLRALRPDLIHAHGAKAGAVGRLARLATPRIPLVFTPHNFSFTNYFASRAEQATYRAVETALAPLTSLVLCVCEAERRVATKLLPSSRTRVVHNGIEPFAALAHDPSLTALRDRGPVLCAVTEFHPAKGVETLIEAMPAILHHQPAATLLVAGEGRLRARLEERIEGLGLGESVRLLGQVEDITTVYAASDLFVQPSWSESFPYAMLEAMSVGLPIVATDVGGVSEAVVDGATGVLVPSRDPSALADAVVSLLAEPGRAESLGRAARDRALTRFRLESMIEGTVSVFAELGLR